MERIFIAKNEKWIYLSLGFLAFIYVFVRAIYMDITFDEAWTIKMSIPQTYGAILFYTDSGSNNHLLNSVLIKFFYSIITEGTFVARLPNILAFIVYLYSYNSIFKRFFGGSSFQSTYYQSFFT